MSVCIYPKLDCESCHGTETVQRFENDDSTVTASCMKCSKYFFEDDVKGLLGQEVRIKKDPKDYTEELLEIERDYPSLDLPERGLKAGCLRRFGVKVGVSMSDGRTPREVYFPQRKAAIISSYKVRILEPKTHYSKGVTTGCDPFGWREAIGIGGYTLYITEGEFDAMALYTMFKRGTEKKTDIAVISLRQGAGSSSKSLHGVLKDITDKFKQVVLVPDQDDAGASMFRDCRNLFPEDYPVKVAKYTEKDANDMLLAGKQAEMIRACYNAGVPLSSGIKEFTVEDFEIIKKPPERGISFPYRGLTKLLRGIRLGTTVYIAAPEKAGKSTLVNEFASHLILEHDESIFAIKPEESEEGTLRRMAGAIVQEIMYDPDREYSMASVDKAANLLAGKLFVLERNQTPEWGEVRQLIREAYLVRGVKRFFIDPITNLSSGMSSSERDSFLHQMTRELAEDAKNLGFTVFIFCHLKTIRDGTPWNEGRIGTADDFQGSRAMVQACDVAIVMQAWMLTEGENVEYMNRRRVLHVIREREYNSVGKVNLLWNTTRGKLEEQEDDE